MKLKTFITKTLSKTYKYLFRKVYFDNHPNCDFNRQTANDRIYNLLINDAPCMISRYGGIEMSVANTILVKHSQGNNLSKIYDYIVDKTDLPWIDEIFYLPISRNAGVFNPTPDILERFGKRYIDDSKLIDLVGSMNYKEKFMPLKYDCQFSHIETLYPFFVNNPWTQALKGKKVLVVHPFAETIKYQYSKRELLFEDTRILPEFDLQCFKAVQSIAGEKVPYKDWFEALHYMETEISKIDFDICILGCGAYGLPLAAFIKRMGKKAIHLGGGTQLLFGIKGKRWEDNYTWNYISPVKLEINYKDLYNEYWVRPNKNEVPGEALKVEGACYW